MCLWGEQFTLNNHNTDYITPQFRPHISMAFGREFTPFFFSWQQTKLMLKYLILSHVAVTGEKQTFLL